MDSNDSGQTTSTTDQPNSNVQKPLVKSAVTVSKDWEGTKRPGFFKKVLTLTTVYYINFMICYTLVMVIDLSSSSLSILLYWPR